MRSFSIVAMIFLVSITVPYLYAAQAGGVDYVFGGFLLNPIDGNTYLAKIYQGWRGDWRFTLPYTAQPGEGAYLYLFYLFLGHLARLLDLPLLWVFHVARVLGALVLLLALRDFLRFSGLPAHWLGWAFALAALGSGLGWLAFPAGIITADFWVAEAYPFLSSFVNPHFALGMALLLWILLPVVDPAEASGGEALDGAGHEQSVIEGRPNRNLPDWLAGLAALFLSILSPFGVALALSVLAVLLIFSRDHLSRQRLLRRFAWVFICGVPLLLYDVWVVRTDPVLAGWNAQNLTPSPALWNVALSLSPALLLALVGGWQVIRRRSTSARTLLIWAVLGMALISVPFGLQRRFMMGLFVPLVGLAGYGLQRMAGRPSRRTTMVAGLVVCLSVPTNLLLLGVAQHGVSTHDLLLYLTRGEAQAMAWIETNTAWDALVLCAPETGLFIPAHTGRRVLYGHPFETVDAEAQKAAVEQFYRSGDPAEAEEFLKAQAVDYVFFGPRERLLGTLPVIPGLGLVYDSAGVQIYQVAR